MMMAMIKDLGSTGDRIAEVHIKECRVLLAQQASAERLAFQPPKLLFLVDATVRGCRSPFFFQLNANTQNR